MVEQEDHSSCEPHPLGLGSPDVPEFQLCACGEFGFFSCWVWADHLHHQQHIVEGMSQYLSSRPGI